MRRKVAVFLILSHLVFLPSYAGEYNALKKLGRGFFNLGLGWMEIINQPIATKNKGSGPSGEFNGFFYGFLKGVVYAVGRTGVGLYEVVTCAIPSYKPVIEPEYIFSASEEMKKSAMEQLYDINIDGVRSSQQQED